MKLYYRSITGILILWLIMGVSSASPQKNKLAKLKSLYTEEKYEEVYQQASAIKNQSNEIIFLEALAFNQLPANQTFKKEVGNKILYPLKKIQKAQGLKDKKTIKYKDFFQTELKKLQEIIFTKAKRLYEKGSKEKARRYFDELHTTFNNSTPLLKNYYAFNDSYFRHTLKKEIEIPQEFKQNFFSRYDLFQKIQTEFFQPIRSFPKILPFKQQI